jgi:protocatechuate 3,4-dioxygenase beta subunit
VKFEKSCARLSVVLGIVASGVVLIGPGPHGISVSAANGTVSGRVFEDLDVDGTADASENGAAGATVKAYDAAGTLVGTTTTAADGTYTLTVTGASTSALRVEFSGPDRWAPSFFGPDNGGNVQFVDIGATNVNYAVQQPGQFCANANITTGMRLAVATMVPGGIQTGAGLPQTGADTMGNCYRQSVSTYSWDGPQFSFDADGQYVDMRTPSQLTRNLETGAMFGLGFDGGTNLLWGSAAIRRHSGLGPRGVGGLYAMRTDGSGVAASFDLTQAPWSLTLSDGRDLSDTARDLSTNPNVNLAYSSDVPGYSAVGKIGIGELEVDAVDGYLWLVNLYEQKLHRIVLNGSNAAPGLGAVTSYTIPQSVCTVTGSVARPFALRLDPTTRHPMVGGVCTNEGATVSAAPNIAKPENGWVMSLDLTNSTFTTLTTFSFDYPHYSDACEGTAAGNTYPPDPNAIDAGLCWPSVWKAWTDDFDAIQTWTDGLDLPPRGPNDFAGAYSQPMLTGLDVLADGSLVVGVADRMNLQTGWYNAPPDATKGSASNMLAQVSASVSGDILLLCKNSDNTYTRETDGGCGTRQAAARVYSGPAAVAGNREFFDDNLYGIFSAPYSGTGSHIELSNGAVQVWPRSGTQEVAFTAMDPAAEFNAGGIRWVSPTTGNAISGVNVTSPSINGAENSPPLFETSSFAKNANMGGLEILCDMAPAEIGNRVWIDSNLDGLQDPGEPGVAGVTVRLYDAEGTLLGTTITDAFGRYYFRSTVSESATGDNDHIGPLPLRTAVQIRFDNPADYAPGGPLHTYGATLRGVASPAGALDGASNSDAIQAGTYPVIDVPPVGSGTVEHTYDVGFVPVHSIGSRAWIDANRNGIQDPGESGFGGVLVELFNPDGSPALTISGATASATTNPDGTYVLSGLMPGNYKIRFTPPSGIPMTTQNAAGSTSANDSDADPDTGWTGVFTLAGSATGDTVGVGDPTHLLGVFSNPTLDVGVIALPVGFGDWVWWEPVRIGDQWEDDLAGIQGVKVELFTADGQPAVDFDGNPVEPQYTSRGGYYAFENLLPGQYRAKFTAPSIYVPTLRFFAGGTLWDDSNIDADGWTDLFTLTPFAGGQMEDDTGSCCFDDADFMNFSIDAGYFVANLPAVALGNYVWFDANRNGVQDPEENPIEGVWVGLYDVNGRLSRDRDGNDVQCQKTDADGRYLFDNLMPGSYRVLFWKDGYIPTFQTVQGAGSGVDSNPATTSATVRAGLGCWYDWGYMTPHETVDGRVSGDTIADTDLNTAAAFVNPTVDAGFTPLVALSNYYWYDTNGDGVRDGDEDGVVGGVVHLLNPDGTQATYPNGSPVPPATTNADGYFEFTGLNPGQYRLRFELVPGWEFTRQGADPTVDNDSNVDPSTGMTDVFSVDGQEVGATYSDDQWDDYANAAFFNPTVGAGLVQPVAVGNFTWIDRNRNGLQDQGEPPLAGVKVELFDANGDPALDIFGVAVPPVFTDANGLYLFDGLLAGEYMIKFTAPRGYAFTSQHSGAPDEDSDASPESGWTDSFWIDADEFGDTVADTDPATRAVFVNPTIDAGFIRLALASVPSVSVGDYVWWDTNGDGRQDATDVPLEGVSLTIETLNGGRVLDVNGNLVGPTLTDAKGWYSFDNLPLGQYVVRVQNPAGFKPTVANVGNLEGDSSTITATSRNLTLGGERDPTLDFGFVRACVSVGRYVWMDSNGNGLQDPGEAPIPGVLLEVRDMNGDPVLDVFGNPVGPQTTDANGEYLFDCLPPGQYQVFITYPAGYGPTREGAGGGVGDSRSVVAVSRTLGDGESDLTLDFGVVPLNMRLPATGGMWGVTVVWAFVLLVVGVGLFGARRRALNSNLTDKKS